MRGGTCCVVLVLALAAGCDEGGPAEMGIESDSTRANPSNYERSIPDEAVQDRRESAEGTGEQTANTERDAAGPSQQESLEQGYALEDFRGRNVLLVFAGSPDVPEYEALKSAWRQNAAAVEEHKLALVESLLRGRSPTATKTLPEGESQVLRSRYGVQPPEFQVLLIDAAGKVLEEGEGLTLAKAIETLSQSAAKPQ